MRTNKRFTEEAIKKLRLEIEDAGGNEVFALGFLDEKGKIAEIVTTARGNEGAVLALQNRLNEEDEISSTASADVLIHNHPSGTLAPSDNDLAISSRAAEDGLGSYIVDNPVENVYVVAEPAKKRVIKKLDSDTIIAALEQGGAIAIQLEQYEVRQSQLDLMRLVIRAFNENALGAAEAGTGVGKSFAYLLPSLSFALLNDERVIISTATITLQQQLYEKDIPLVISALPGLWPGMEKKNIKAVLVKGRANYLCLRRLEEALKEPPLDEEEIQSLEAITLWSQTANTGSRSELSFIPPEGLWSRLCSEPDLCMAMRCPQREHCFVMALRREAADAQVIVVNHHLLFADLAARQKGAGYDNTVVLPPAGRIIIDEAHNMEDAATSYFSESFSRIGIYRCLSRLYRKSRRGLAKSGLLVRMASLLPVQTGNSFLGEGMAGEENRIAAAINKVREATDDLDEAGLELCGAEGVFRLTLQKDEITGAILKVPLLALGKCIRALSGLIREMLEEADDTKEEGLIWEVRSLLRQLDNTGTLCNSFLDYLENQDKVLWIEKHSGARNAGSDWAIFNETPLEVSTSLKEALFEPCKTVVCVSATLTVGQGEASFEYWKSRAGLGLVQNRDILTGIFPSPFPYDSSVLLGVPSDAPLPAEPGFSTYVDNAVTSLLEIAGGSALVLFTSYLALRSAWETAKPRLEEQGIRVLKQGDDDRSRLLRTFLEDETSVLFATDSFWEGVDAPGDTLRLVILCRLPFRTPNDPVFEARCEALEEAGGNSFMDLSLPEAVMRFKQGFGRLMRRSSDHGAVTVLDGRLLKKQYGRIFLQSLPETRTCFTGFSDLLRSVENFLY